MSSAAEFIIDGNRRDMSMLVNQQVVRQEAQNSSNKLRANMQFKLEEFLIR